MKVGDTVRARVMSVDADTGAVRLGRSFGKTGDIGQIEQARASGVAIEGKVTGVNKGGLELEVKSMRAFMPRSTRSMVSVERAARRAKSSCPAAVCRWPRPS